jgi:SAM-dependent methyltransferase
MNRAIPPGAGRQGAAVNTGEEEALATIRKFYTRAEPAGTEGWSPLQFDQEMWHRIRLVIELCRCLRLIPDPIAKLRVLDVGCGAGRSSRLLVDLGVEPQNLVAIDFRETAIATAMHKNPAIRFQHIASLAEWPRERFDLVLQSTAFSSLPGLKLREATAYLMGESACEGGYIFWWDLLRANDFAGGEILDPKSLFPRFQLLRERRVALYTDLSDSLRRLRGIGNWISSVLGPFVGHRPTHLSALLRDMRRCDSHGPR